MADTTRVVPNADVAYHLNTLVTAAHRLHDTAARVEKLASGLKHSVNIGHGQYRYFSASEAAMELVAAEAAYKARMSAAQHAVSGLPNGDDLFAEASRGRGFFHPADAA